MNVLDIYELLSVTDNSRYYRRSTSIGVTNFVKVRIAQIAKR